MAHTFTNLLYHLVFSTKGRRPQIDHELKEDLFAYLGGTVRGIGGVPLIVNGVADHVHMLVVLPQTTSVADALRTVKANSSGWVHERWPERRDFAWQTGYGAFTVSESRRDTVRRYIADQEAHHRKATFEEEKRSSWRC
jgi:REP element-mobilizing transposase RayT